MRVILDVFGGDNAPHAVLEGAVMAKSELSADITLCGNIEKIKACAKEKAYDISGMELIDAEDEFDICEEPSTIIKRKTTSLYVALNALKEGKGDCLVSAGSTGGVLAGGTLIVKRLKGVKRGAIGTVIPGLKHPFVLVDTGANTDCRKEMFMQFARMGDSYAKGVLNVKNPRIGILCNGVEESKGRELEQQASELLRNSDLNYVGFIEAKTLFLGGVDVIVTDGFSGNIMLKTAEGVAKMMTVNLKEMMFQNAKTKFAALLLKSGFKGFKAKMDPSEYGGSPILGLSKPIIKAHGSSDAKSIKNAIRQAISCAENDVCNRIEQGMINDTTSDTK